MSERKTVIEFTRGVLDRIRERCREVAPAEWEKVDAIHTEVTGKIAKTGDRVALIRERTDGRVKK